MSTTRHLCLLREALKSRTLASNEYRWMKEVASNPEHLTKMVSRRVDGEPLQYILGTQPFGGLDLLVRSPVLIPRPETEDWAHRLSKLFSPTEKSPVRVLDLCTGTGCIPLLLCSLWPPKSTSALGVDISPDAVSLAGENNTRASHGNTFTARLADITVKGFVNSLEPPYNLITSNPPYIPRVEYDALPDSVKLFEDKGALLGELPNQSDPRGLSFYRVIANLLRESPTLLHPEGVVALEVGKGQAREVEEIMRGEANLANVEIWEDPWKVERTVVARW